MSPQKRTPWKFGLDSSTLLNQNLINNFGSEYINNRLTNVRLTNQLIKVPMIQYFPLQPTRKRGYPPCPNRWRESTYHLNQTFRTGMIYVPPVYTGKVRNGRIVFY